MADCHDRRAAVREELDPLIRELHIVSASLEEVATTWRRMAQFRVGFPAQPQEAAHQLVSTVRALAEAGADQRADLAASAMAQLSALKRSILSSETVTSGTPGTTDSGLWAAVTDALDRADTGLWSLISRLCIRDFPLLGPADTGVARPAPVFGPDQER
jgi:hypothetical protein